MYQDFNNSCLQRSGIRGTINLRLHMKIVCAKSRIKDLLRFEICAHEICEQFVYKHCETIEQDKNNPFFKKFTNQGPITQESLAL